MAQGPQACPEMGAWPPSPMLSQPAAALWPYSEPPCVSVMLLSSVCGVEPGEVKSIAWMCLCFLHHQGWMMLLPAATFPQPSSPPRSLPRATAELGPLGSSATLTGSKGQCQGLVFLAMLTE